jgi:cytochrome c
MPNKTRLSRFLSLLVGSAGALLIASIDASAQPAKPNAKPPVASEKGVPRATAKEARLFLDRAVRLLKEKPQEMAFAAFNNQKGEFVRQDLYVFVVGFDGVMHAHGGAPEGLVGMQVEDLRDASGKALIREMLDAAKSKGSGEVDYVWLNRVTNRVESKTAFVQRVGDNVVGVGFYVPRSSAEQARSFLDKAVAEIGRVGAADAFAAFNNRKGAFVRDDLYVFAIGLDDAKFYAMGATPGLVGAGVRDLRDAAGKPIIQDMIALVREKGSGEYEYVWRNPANNKVEAKRSFVQRVDSYLVGVGYYTR